MTDTTVNSTTQRPEVGKIGVGVAAIINNGKGQILLGKRKGSHGSGTWQLPGGHLEYQEELFACAEREAKEETGLDIKAVRIETLTNDVFRSDHKHYITIFAQCEMVDPQAQPQLMEPEKCEGWYWKTWEELRDLRNDGEPLFLPMINLLNQTPDLTKLQL